MMLLSIAVYLAFSGDNIVWGTLMALFNIVWGT